MTVTAHRPSSCRSTVAVLAALAAGPAAAAAGPGEKPAAVLQRTLFDPVDEQLTGGDAELKKLVGDLALVRKTFAEDRDPTARATQALAECRRLAGDAGKRGRAAYVGAQLGAVLADYHRARRPEATSYAKALLADLDTALASVPELRAEILAERGRARAVLARLDTSAARELVPRLVDALGDLDQALALQPEWPRALVERGRVELELAAVVAEFEGEALARGEQAQPHLERALADFEAAARREAVYVDALTGAASALERLGRWPEAVERLEIASQAPAAGAPVRAELARARETSSKRPAAVAAAKAAAAKALDAGDFALAVKQCDEALRLDGADAQALVLRGQARLYQGELDRAEADLTRAITLAPDDALAHALRGQVRAESKRLPEAVVDLQRALAIDPRLLDAVVGLALAYLRMGDLDRSIELGEKGVARGPEWFSGWYNLAAAYSRRSAAPGRDAAARKQDRDRAFAALDAYANGAPKDQASWESTFKDPNLAALRTDPRFKAVLQKLGPGRPKRTVEDWAEDTTR
jgi:tetratricopeptide (TPR) repeat protein